MLGAALEAVDREELERIVSRGEGGVERAVAGEVVETTTPRS